MIVTCVAVCEPTDQLIPVPEMFTVVVCVKTSTKAVPVTVRVPESPSDTPGGLMPVIAGGALAMALSEGLRSKVLDALFGSEEEFDYTSTTMPATPAPEPVSKG